jgi:hypothetical protein
VRGLWAIVFTWATAAVLGWIALSLLWNWLDCRERARLFASGMNVPGQYDPQSIESIRGRRSTSSTYTYSYRYRVGGIEYRADDRRIHEPPAVTPITVYYDPGDPGRCVSDAEHEYVQSMKGWGWLAIPLLIGGLAGLSGYAGATHLAAVSRNRRRS